MLFTSDEQLNGLFNSNTLLAGGTFRVSPKLFEQLYVLHGIQHGECVYIFFSCPINSFLFGKKENRKIRKTKKKRSIMCIFDEEGDIVHMKQL